MLIGILKPGSQIIDTEKVFMTVAKAHGHEAFVFMARNIDFEKKHIIGMAYEKGKLVKKRYRFPDVVQNRLPMLKEEDAPLYAKLEQFVPFTTHHIGSKVEICKKMEDDEVMRKYVIEAHAFQSTTQLLEFLERHPYTILKPAYGKQAQGILTIRKETKTRYALKEQGVVTKMTKKQLIEFFDNRQNNRNYFISPFFESKTNHDLSTVFRLHMILGEEGRWQKIKFFPYVNLRGNEDITNGMQGALITTREELFLKQYYPEHVDKILAGVDQLFKDTSVFMNTLYPWPIDAVGLDVGITQEGDIKVFEINAGPGVGFMAYPVAEQQILYYEWLVEQPRSAHRNFLPQRWRHYYQKKPKIVKLENKPAVA